MCVQSSINPDATKAQIPPPHRGGVYAVICALSGAGGYGVSPTVGGDYFTNIIFRMKLVWPAAIR